MKTNRQTAATRVKAQRVVPGSNARSATHRPIQQHQAQAAVNRLAAKKAQ